MRTKIAVLAVVVAAMAFFAPSSAVAWDHHPLVTAPVLSTMPEVMDAPVVAAESLEAFLLDVEQDLAILLEEEETWARANMEAYKPRPDALTFQATGQAADIRERFFRAIRVNPGIQTPLYVSPLAGTNPEPGTLLAPSNVSILHELTMLGAFDFEQLAEGELAYPVDIIATASNEPDYGMDIGLFEDNGTDFGQEYGFGVQPFGNPGLDYGSQAPFHMGFYHESPIVYFFASFLNECYPEYRIHLYKSLSEFAFDHGHDYWGWRFMGWGLHYLADLSMPYHTAPLPGHTAFEMILVSLLDMLGIPEPQADAVQLSSNRHVALESFGANILVEATRDNDEQDLIMAALLEERAIPTYSDETPRLVAGVAHGLTTRMDRTIERLMPNYYVSDPSVELGDIPEHIWIANMVFAEHGPQGVAAIEKQMARAMKAFADYGRSFVLDILAPEE